jgi:hypothetical protein
MNDLKAEHIVLYMKPKYLLRWKRIVLISKNPTFIYSSNSDILGKRIEENFTMLWVVSPVEDEQHPALVAKMKVQNLAKMENKKLYPQIKIPKKMLKEFSERENKWIVTALEEESVYFGYNNASDALLDTPFGLKKAHILRQTNKEWKSSTSSFFPGPRIVTPESIYKGDFPGIKPLQDLAKTEERSVFISYKWCDGVADKAIALAHALAKIGIMSWLDQLAFPKADYSKELRTDSLKLEKLLRYGYSRCKVIVGFGTENYGKLTNQLRRNWTMREWAGELSDSKRPYRILFPQPGFKKKGLFVNFKEDMTLKSEDINNAALEIKEWFETLTIH